MLHIFRLLTLDPKGKVKPRSKHSSTVKSFEMPEHPGHSRCVYPMPESERERGRERDEKPHKP